MPQKKKFEQMFLIFHLADAPTGYDKRLQVYIGKGLDSCIIDVGLFIGSVRPNGRF